jgi:hypothetical protein
MAGQELIGHVDCAREDRIEDLEVRPLKDYNVTTAYFLITCAHGLSKKIWGNGNYKTEG